MDSLALAMSAAASPIRHVQRAPETAFAAVIGMAGAAAEQALSSILIQVDGDNAVFAHGQRYKTAGQVLSDIGQLLRAPPVARAGYLTAGLADPNAHRAHLLKAMEAFRLLVEQRAAALHGGYGASRAVALHSTRVVHAFLVLLAQSTRIKPYLSSLPEMAEQPTEPFVIVDELAQAFSSASSAVQKGSLLRQLFLVLPAIPANEPDWIGAFQRVAVLPTEGDIRLLVTTLQAAQPARLARLTGTGRAIPVIPSSLPSALPIELQALRREFSTTPQQVAGDIANANGRLTTGVLHLPPESVVAALFAMPEEELIDAFSTERLSAHQAWPFVAAALRVSGTPRPYWFVVRRTNDLGQLRALLVRAADAAGAVTAFANRIGAEVLPGIQAIEHNRQLSASSPYVNEMRTKLNDAIERSSKLGEAVDRSGRSGTRGLTPIASDTVTDMSQGFAGAREAWGVIENGGIADSSRRDATRSYWARLIAEATTEPNDVLFLTKVASDATLTGAHTAARKALRLIDAMTYGPSMALEA
ncbi:hypothetical protein SE336_18595 [Xanthomonas arboricola]|uniref:hypothetical protein n=2 Tax=Xanthomonas arboricola TaxID=56448 RepID=UPI0039F49A67